MAKEYKKEEKDFLFVEDLRIEGKMSVIASVDRSRNPPVLSVTGMIETPVRLPDSFKSCRGGRVAVFDVMIDSESLGTLSNVIVYGFSARSYEIYERSNRNDDDDTV